MLLVIVVVVLQLLLLLLLLLLLVWCRFSFAIFEGTAVALSSTWANTSPAFAVKMSPLFRTHRKVVDFEHSRRRLNSRGELYVSRALYPLKTPGTDNTVFQNGNTRALEPAVLNPSTVLWKHEKAQNIQRMYVYTTVTKLPNTSPPRVTAPVPPSTSHNLAWPLHGGGGDAHGRSLSTPSTPSTGSDASSRQTKNLPSARMGRMPSETRALLSR